MKKVTSEDLRRRRRATAYHEAGHAVAAYHHDTKVMAVSIIADDDSLGHCRTKTPKWFRPDEDVTPRARLKVESEIIGRFAGNLAERKITGKNDWQGARSDQAQAADLACYLFPDNAVIKPFLRYVHARAEAFVESPLVWHDIQHVARALLKRRQLSGPEVVKLIQESQEQFLAKTSGKTR